MKFRALSLWTSDFYKLLININVRLLRSSVIYELQMFIICKKVSSLLLKRNDLYIYDLRDLSPNDKITLYKDSKQNYREKFSYIKNL